ncbi:MAG: GGDEF domain-containing response regulator [Chlamydiales bacterium]|nr:GGDEF domain-containing response regulator [Chlamydiales bacterium]
MGEKFTILLIEDEQEDLACIQDALNKLHDKGIEFTIKSVATIKEATALLVENEYDLILTDLYLKDSSSVETIRKIQEASSTIPIIATSEHADEEVIRQIIRLGAQDYLTKEELDPAHLQRVIYASVERNRLQQSLRALSFTDEMTGLYNRRGFFTLLEQQLLLSKRTRQGFFLFVIDLDYLKVINDTYGHPAGDRALMDVADCLQLSFRHHDIVGRIGGDEFAVIAINAAEDSFDHIKHKIHYKFQEQNERSTEPYQLGISMGAAYFSGHGEISIQDLFNKADKSLYEAKKEAHIKLTLRKNEGS